MPVRAPQHGATVAARGTNESRGVETPELLKAGIYFERALI